MVSEKRNGKITEYNKPWIEQRADPYIYKHSDGLYYFTASVPEYDRIILRRAKTIKGLKDAEEFVIWKCHESGEMSKHIWAPEIHYLDNKWYIYYAAGEKEDAWKIRPYILECEGNNPVEDLWIEKGKIQRANEDIYSFEAFSLDATVFEHKGKRYFVWAEKVSVGIQISNLYIAEMESPTKLKSEQVLLTTPDYDWERRGIWVNEAPSVIKRNGKIFMTYSASSTGSGYCMGMLSIDENDDILDPKAWTKERYPVLQTDSGKGIFGPGHNAFFKDNEDNDICIYHARTYEEIIGDPLYDPNRHAMLMKVNWSKDGKPVFKYENYLDI